MSWRVPRAAFRAGVLLASTLSGSCVVAPTEGAVDPRPVPWTERTVEHLYNRAAFGATQAEVAAALERRPEEIVDELLSTRGEWVRYVPKFGEWWDLADLRRLRVPPDIGLAECRRLRLADGVQFLQYSDQWFDAMREHHAPVRDRMTLFWHGHFTTAFEVIFRSFELIHQHQMLRNYALGDFGTLLHATLEDPAMLVYLDNDTNAREDPNENLARELLELFTLGEGHFTERDVREVARALTGYGTNNYGGFQFHPEQHDSGPKTILGTTGNYDVESLVALLLEQDQCARFLAGELIEWFEGLPPETARRERYANLLAEGGYELTPFLRTLFLDPDFYRDEVVGTRIQGPIEWLVSVSRRLEVDPPDAFVFQAASRLGQRFYEPPTVEGWQEGLAWIDAEKLMSRGNCAGALLGVYDEREPVGGESPEDEAVASALEATLASLRRLASPAGATAETRLGERLRRAGQTTDAAILHWLTEELLACEPFEDTRRVLTEFLRRECEERGIPRDALLESADAELVLRRLAHMILSLPEAQLG